MSSRKTNSISINKYKTKREMNIGIIIFTVIFIYLIVTVVMFAFQKKISVYEVREGNILRDNSYTGLAIRHETVVNSEKDGYVHYFQNSQTKMKTGVPAYGITTNKLTYEKKVESEGEKLNSDDQRQMVIKLQKFNETFDPQRFSDVYTLKNDVNNVLLKSSNETKTTKVDALLKMAGKQASIFQTTSDGILLLNIDGYEDITIDSFEDADLNRSKYRNIIRHDNVHVKKGEPVYKLVSDNHWSVIIQVDRKISKELKQLRVVKTRLDKNNNSIWAEVDTFKKDGKYYAVLNYNSSMITYTSKRFLNVELIFDDESGLKIPKSSMVNMDAYLIPKSFITYGGNEQAEGITVLGSDGERKFQTCKIYKETSDDMVYISTDKLKMGTTIEKAGDGETLKLSYPRKIVGVYQINRGYAVFTQITKLGESDDYCIIEANDKYGLRNYDHIVQEGGTVSEGEIVF